MERCSHKTEKLIENGYELFKTMKVRRIKDIKIIDSRFQNLIDKISG